MAKLISLTRANDGQHKYTAVVEKDGTNHTVHFGSLGYQDYTKHRNPQRKQLYLGRHRYRENWTASGVTTGGFWARWLLWNKETISASLADVKERFSL